METGRAIEVLQDFRDTAEADLDVYKALDVALANLKCSRLVPSDGSVLQVIDDAITLASTDGWSTSARDVMAGRLERARSAIASLIEAVRNAREERNKRFHLTGGTLGRMWVAMLEAAGEG